jgi:hypothetical protein
MGYVSVAGATAGQLIESRFPTAMRLGAAVATVTFYNPNAANAFTRNFIANTDSTATSIFTGTNTAMLIQFTGIAAWTVAQSVGVHFTIDAEL